MNKIALLITLIVLTSCSAFYEPPPPVVVRDSSRVVQSRSNSTEIESPQTPLDPVPEQRAQIPQANTSLVQRPIYIASAGNDGDGTVLAAIRSELTQRDDYFARFSFINQSIDEIRLGDRGNLAVDLLQRTAQRQGADLVVSFFNPFDAGVFSVTIDLYCVRTSQLIASDTQSRRVLNEAGGATQALTVATKAAFEAVVNTYIRRVEQGNSCPQMAFEER